MAVALKRGRTEQSLTIEQAADRLGVHYMTVYRYVRIGRLPAEYHDGRWHIEADDLPLVERSRRSRGSGRNRAGGDGDGPAAEGSLIGAADRLLDRLLAGDSAGSWLIVENALLAGGPADVYLEILAPCLRRIGDAWADGSLSIADEHRATAMALGIVGRLGPLFGRRGRRRAGTVLLAGAEGDPHAIPLMMVADVLRSSGFGVVQLGANVPVGTLLTAAAVIEDLLAIGISASTEQTALNAGEAAARLHEQVPGVPVFLGGPAIADEDRAAALGADGWAANAAATVRLVTACERRP